MLVKRPPVLISLSIYGIYFSKQFNPHDFHGKAQREVTIEQSIVQTEIYLGLACIQPLRGSLHTFRTVPNVTFCEDRSVTEHGSQDNVIMPSVCDPVWSQWYWQGHCRIGSVNIYLSYKCPWLICIKRFIFYFYFRKKHFGLKSYESELFGIKLVTCYNAINFSYTIMLRENVLC